MSDKLRLIATTAALLVSGWIGHGIGSSDRQAAEHRAARLETQMRDSEARHRQAQIALAEELRSREAAFEVRLRELQVSFDEQKVEMIEALDDSQAQLADLAQRRRDTDAELLRVRKALASEPACASVRQNAPNHWPLAIGRKNVSFCHASPNRSIGPQPTELVTEIMVDVAPSPTAISSSATAAAKVSKPAPPHSVGTVMPYSPNSPSLRNASAGNSCASAQRAAFGANSRAAKSAKVSRSN